MKNLTYNEYSKLQKFTFGFLGTVGIILMIPVMLIAIPCVMLTGKRLIRKKT